MKKKIGIFLAIVMVISMIVALSLVTTFAEEKEITISYMNTQETTSDTTSLDTTAYSGGKQVVKAGESFTLPTTSSSTYTGQDGYQLIWYTENGRTYKAGETVSFTEDTKLFRCVAKECYNLTDVNYAMANNSTAAILMADISANSNIGVKDQGQAVLILNGFSITITKNSSNFMGSQRSGKHIYGEGTINAINPDGKLGEYSFFQDQSHGYNGSANKTVVGADVTINAPTMWLGSDGDGSYNNHYPWTRIYGKVNCYGFISISNLNNRAPLVEIFDGANVTVNGPHLFKDFVNRSNNKHYSYNTQAFELRIYGGTLNLPIEAATEEFWTNDNTEKYVVNDKTYYNYGLTKNTQDVIRIFGGTFILPENAAPAINDYLTNDWIGSIPSGGDGIYANKNTSTYYVAYMHRPGIKLAFEKYTIGEGNYGKLTVTDYIDGSLSGTYYYQMVQGTVVFVDSYNSSEITQNTVNNIKVFELTEGGEYVETTKFKLEYAMNSSVLFTNSMLQKDMTLQAYEGKYIVAPAGCAHTFEETVVEATCQTQGYVTSTCTLCGYSVTTILEQKQGHNFELTNHEAASLTKLGSKTYKCSDCEFTKTTSYSLDPSSLEVFVTIRHDDGTFTEETVLAQDIFEFSKVGSDGDYIYTLSAIKAFGDYKIRNIYGVTIPKGILYINITTYNNEKYNNVEYGLSALTFQEGISIQVQNIGNLRNVEKIVVEKNTNVTFAQSCSYYNPNNEKRGMPILNTIDLSAGNHTVEFMSNAFDGRSKIANLLLGENAAYSFGHRAFNNCAITSLSFKESSEYTFTGTHSFYGNDMAELVFPDNMDINFQQNTFENCVNLVSVKFGQNATYSIGSYCFYKSSITKLVFAPYSTYTISTQAFSNKTLEELDMSAGNMNVTFNNSAFSMNFDKADQNDVFTSLKFGANSTYYFAKESFNYTNIEKLVLAANSEYSFIEYCFNNVPNLTTIDASAEGITVLWSGNAFKDRKTLTTIIFGKNGNHTFNGSCLYNAPISELIFADDSTYLFKEGCFSSTNIAKIDASANNLDVTFKYRAFRDRTTLTELLINGKNSIYNFENESFYNTKFTALTFGEGSTYTFGSYPFGNTNIVSLDATASNVTASFNGGVFSGKTSLVYIAFGENSTYVIGDNAFNGTNPTNDIVFSSTSTFTIGKEAFKQTDFASVTFEDNCNVTFKGTNAFGECSAKELYIGKNIAITNYPFKNFKSLELLIIMDGVTHTSEYEFENSGSADFTTPFVVYNHSYDLVFNKGMFKNCDGVILYTITDNIGTRNDVFMDCADGTGYKAWTVYLGIPHQLIKGQVDPTCTEVGGEIWVGNGCPCGHVIAEETIVNVYENKHNIGETTEYARQDVYAVNVIPALGHTRGEIVAIVYENGFMQVGYKHYDCTVCDDIDVDVENPQGPIFKDMGYAYSEVTYAITHAFAVDNIALVEYNTYAENKIGTYGLVAANSELVTNGMPLASVGTAVNGAVSVDYSAKSEFDIFEMKIKGLEAYADLGLYCTAYYTVGDDIYYLENGEAKTSLSSPVSFNNLKQLDLDGDYKVDIKDNTEA